MIQLQAKMDSLLTLHQKVDSLREVVHSNVRSRTPIFNETPLTMAAKHKCTVCGQNFKTGGDLEEHARGNDHRTYACEEAGWCDKNFATRDGLRKHKSEKHRPDSTSPKQEQCTRTLGPS
jgi:uncharacterized Zn-finger protein